MYKIKVFSGLDERKSQPVIRIVDNGSDDDILMDEKDIEAVAPALSDDGRDGEAQIPDVQKSLYDLTQSDMDELIEAPRSDSDDYLKRYREKLDSHRRYVREAFDLMDRYMPGLVEEYGVNGLMLSTRIDNHDMSKYRIQEFPHYARHYFGTQTIESERDYMGARLHHIHHNPHHWHYWCYPVKGQVLAVEMENGYMLEMICDWMSFGLAEGNILEVLDFYKNNNNTMYMASKTRADVESILARIGKVFG